jgi:nitrogenase-stabilizing/protective protein
MTSHGKDYAPADLEAADFEAEIADLESAEDFLDYFAIFYDPQVVQVNRLHILQRFHDYLGRYRDGRPPTRAEYRTSLALAYDDFVHSDAITEKVFRVLKQASGITVIPLSAIGRTRH